MAKIEEVAAQPQAADEAQPPAAARPSFTKKLALVLPLALPLVALALPYPLVFGLWTLLMALAVWLSLRTMQSVLPVPAAALPIVALAALSYQPLFRSFMLGQNSPLVLLGLCGTYAAVKRGNQA